jgi:hypothetical protein
MARLDSSTSRARKRPSRRELRAQQTLAARCQSAPDAPSVSLEDDIIAQEVGWMREDYLRWSTTSSPASGL